MPGRHIVEVIVLWELAGVPVAVSGEHDVFVSYVGKAVAFGDLAPFERAAQRIRRAQAAAGTHPANEALNRLGLSR
jgi:hypothetical protein